MPTPWMRFRCRSTLRSNPCPRRCRPPNFDHPPSGASMAAATIRRYPTAAMSRPCSTMAPGRRRPRHLLQQRSSSSTLRPKRAQTTPEPASHPPSPPQKRRPFVADRASVPKARNAATGPAASAFHRARHARFPAECLPRRSAPRADPTRAMCPKSVAMRAAASASLPATPVRRNRAQASTFRSARRAA